MSSSAAKYSKTNQKRDPSLTLSAVPNNLDHRPRFSSSQNSTAKPKARHFAPRHGPSSLDLSLTKSVGKTRRLLGTSNGRELRSIRAYRKSLLTLGLFAPPNNQDLYVSSTTLLHQFPSKRSPSKHSFLRYCMLASRRNQDHTATHQTTDISPSPCQKKICQHHCKAQNLLPARSIWSAPPILSFSSNHHWALQWEVLKNDRDLSKPQHHRPDLSFWFCPSIFPVHDAVLPLHSIRLSPVEALEEMHPQKLLSLHQHRHLQAIPPTKQPRSAPPMLPSSSHHRALQWEVLKNDRDLSKPQHHHPDLSFWFCPSISPVHDAVLPLHSIRLSPVEALEEMHPQNSCFPRITTGTCRQFRQQSRNDLLHQFSLFHPTTTGLCNGKF